MTGADDGGGATVREAAVGDAVREAAVQESAIATPAGNGRSPGDGAASASGAVWRWPVWGLAGASLVAVLVATWRTAPQAVPGITLPGPLVQYGLPVTRLFMELFALAAVGLSLLPKLLGFDDPGRTEPVMARARVWAVLAAFGWAVAALVAMLLGAAEVVPGRFPDPGGYVEAIGAGQGLVLSAACALAYTFFGLLALRFGEKVPAELRVIVAVFGLLPLPVSGHASNWYWHDLSMVSMELHVVGAALWTGGLAATAVLLARHRDLLARALPAFSRLATVALLVVGLSGLFSALVELALSPTTRLPGSLFTTEYGLLVVAKLVCFGALGLLGAHIRWRLMPAIARGGTTAFAAWAAMEVTVMGLAYGVAVAITRAPVA
ncbi:copper resistance protein CopD [Sphaerisporangium melleum]|uniref:Copper resistance protein CopD n=1 Tax=Sphaerisporangium melleum TaxID=321316 RepID=A0A917VJ79_9ACTN|nr:CopD family protein [Sphaerisporangium melleum]GGK90305.1 copper resistance protein CopD [Sphaerisporangium melleum]GII72881.1 copper resistance protein CopD [Sphaerisporangium melleum]